MIADRQILTFLQDIAVNNNREWFKANKARYDAAHEAFLKLTSHFIDLASAVDLQIGHPEAQKCVYRIYRDVRFSKDKRPYKEWFGVFPAAPAPGKPKSGGKKSMRGGYYVHLQPGNCMFAGGIWGPTPELLKALRQEVYANYDEVEAIMQSPHWQRYFGDFDTEWMLKKVPQGFDKDFVHADWLKRKAYTFSTPLTDEQVCRPDFVEQVLDIARAAQPMNDFLNYTFEEYGEFPSYDR